MHLQDTLIEVNMRSIHGCARRQGKPPGVGVKEAASILKVSPRQLQYWVSQGLVGQKKSAPQAKQKGRPLGSANLRFDKNNLVIAAIIREIMKQKYGTDTARMVLKALFDYRKKQAYPPNRFSTLLLDEQLYAICDEEHLAVVEGNLSFIEKLEVVTGEFPSFIVFNLTKIAKELEQRLRELKNFS